jgi:protocatechuate 3,4-dioxygenase beta subunit
MPSAVQLARPALAAIAALAALAPHTAAAQDCDTCGVREAPRALRATATLAPAGEPGDPLVISGTVFQPDGRTPVPGAVVYAYHANAAGVYPKRGGESGIARWHGYLRGWARTDARGRFEFRTVRPGTYPTRAEPAHVHFELLAPDGRGYAINDLIDDADPLVDARWRARMSNRGGSGIARFTRDAAGVWHARRDVVLER